MTFDEIKKRYERFLKEMGVYKRVIDIHSGRVNGLPKRNISYQTIIKANTYPRSWIQSCGTFCTWSRTPEKDVFWWAISLLWQAECIENDIYTSDEYRLTDEQLIEDFRRYLAYLKMDGIKENTSISINTIANLKDKVEEKLEFLKKRVYDRENNKHKIRCEIPF